MPKIVVKQNGQTRDIPLVKESVSIGRTPENDIELKDSLISRRHTSIVKKGDRWVVYDLGSSNGTFVNRERIESKPLEDGDVIRIGDSELLFLDDPRAVPMPRGTDRHVVPGSTKPTDMYSSQQIVQKVNEIAESYSLDVAGDLSSRGLSLRDIRKDAGQEKKAGFFRILFEVGKSLSASATLDEMLQIAVRLILEVVNAERIVILLKPPGETDVAPRLAYHRTKGFMDPREIAVSRTITSQVVGEKVSIITSDALQDPRFMQGLSIVQFNIRSALCVPLWEAQQVYGAIYLDNVAKSYAFTKDDLELMTAIANLIAIRIRGEETQAKLRQEETLRTNLSKYHSPDVVNMLMTRGADVGLEVTERDVSVVFIDVVSSTTLAETTSAPQIAALLNEFFLMATNAIFEHKGSVNKFIGDEVMAIFNAPLDMPDHAVAAVRACVTFLKDLERFNAANPARKFDVRCAVNSGTAVAGNVGTPTRMEYTVLGDTVNTAARLSKLPQINSIVIGEKTQALVKDVFRTKDLGEQHLKGKEKGLRAYEVLR
ncbi:MAG TPA: adenylate/guanylate cyclase domain-containing protein [Planctomycetota bacterium]|nr:adenylate/guanylate cyclase domain-containing protein [Planctomycetota bacterium]